MARSDLIKLAEGCAGTGVRELTLPQLEVLWSGALQLGPEALIFPFRREHESTAERLGGLERAEDELLAARLLHRDGSVDPFVADALALFARPGTQVDLRLALAPGEELRAAVARHGELAARGILRGGVLRLEPIRPTALAEALVSVLPDVGAARGRSVSVHVAALTALGVRRVETDGAAERVLGEFGMPTSDARTLVELVGGERLRFGQIGAESRDRHGKVTRSPRLLHVVDKAAGRAALVSRAAHVTAVPADFAKLVVMVTDLLAGG